ncbi:hypothetical protein F5Y04DRAFT_259799 [Hypomontagnella monticulosa]|nr:hypothetical protein F5Y04DRAFT_259799 [Hypomontagnella monticulosa]
MAEKPQTEGVIDTQPTVQPSPMRDAPLPGIPKNVNEQQGSRGGPQPQLADLIQDEDSNIPRMETNKELPQIVQERDPPMVTPLHMLTPNPTWIDCPSCKLLK